jgi:molecular chaperone GrpE
LHNSELIALRTQLAERTNDLQRITAEYANYRKRMERDRIAVVEHGTAVLLTTLLPVLDDIERARSHGDLEGAFASVAEQLLTLLGKSGLRAFGEVDEKFDPLQHEAVTHEVSPDVSEATCTQVLRRGYWLGERLLRTALVAVTEPASGATSDAPPTAVASADSPEPVAAGEDSSHSEQ